MLILHVTLHALGAKLAAIEGKIFPRLKTNNSVVLYAKLNAALLPAKAAMGFDELLIFRCTSPPARRHTMQRGTEYTYQFWCFNRKSGHYSSPLCDISVDLHNASWVSARFFLRHRGQTS